MKVSFSHAAPVVDYAPSARPHRYAQAGRRWFLWPALAYRVVGTAPVERPFNLFQAHILKMARAGVKTAEAISSRSALPLGLVAYVIGQLQSLGFLDGDGMPTERALREMEDQPRDEQVVVGYVFQDPFTGELWPRFMIGSMPKIDVTVDENRGGAGSVVCGFETGPVGRPITGTARGILPRPAHNVTWGAPSAQQILTRFRLHKRHQRNYLRALGEEPDWAVSPAHELPARIASISVTEQVPSPVFLLSFVYVPADIVSGSLWQVCDPFGLGTSTQLRQQVEGLIEAGQGELFRRMIEDLTGTAYQVSAIDLAELLAAQHASAMKRVEERLGAHVNSSQIELRLAAMEEAADPALLAGRANFAAQQDRTKAVVRATSAAIEEICATIQERYPPGAALSALGSDAIGNAQFLAKMASSQGFQDVLDDARFEGFFSVTGDQIEAAANAGRRGLREQFAAMVVSGHDAPLHPVRRLAREWPECVRFLSDVKAARDKASHGSDEPVLAEVEQCIQGVYRFLRGLLPELGGGTEIVPNAAKPADIWHADVLNRVRLQAAQRVEACLGPCARDYPAVFGQLVEMQCRVMEIAALVPEEAQWAKPERRLTDCLVAGCASLEAAMREVLASSPPPDSLAPPVIDGRMDSAKLVQAAVALGFRLLGPGLPISLATVQIGFVRDAIRFKRVRSLGAAVVATVIAANASAEHPLRDLAKANPDFLLQIGDLVDRRGHGDRVRLETTEVAHVSATVMKIAKAILDTLP